MIITLNIPDAEFNRYPQYYKPFIVDSPKGSISQLACTIRCPHCGKSIPPTMQYAVIGMDEENANLKDMVDKIVATPLADQLVMTLPDGTVNEFMTTLLRQLIKENPEVAKQIQKVEDRIRDHILTGAPLQDSEAG